MDKLRQPRYFLLKAIEYNNVIRYSLLGVETEIYPHRINMTPKLYQHAYNITNDKHPNIEEIANIKVKNNRIETIENTNDKIFLLLKKITNKDNYIVINIETLKFDIFTSKQIREQKNTICNAAIGNQRIHPKNNIRMIDYGENIISQLVEIQNFNLKAASINIAALKCYVTKNGIVCKGFLDKTEGNQETVVIPEFVNIIDKEAFAKNTNIKTLILGNNVIVIKPSAFEDCLSLSEVKFNKKLEAICDNAFRGTNITSINLQGKLSFIGDSAFSGPHSTKVYKEIDIENTNISTLRLYAFGNHYTTNIFKFPKHLKELDLTDGVCYLHKANLVILPENFKDLEFRNNRNNIILGLVKSKITTKMKILEFKKLLALNKRKLTTSDLEKAISIKITEHS